MVCLLVALASTARAQETTLSGIVTDTTDAVLPGVRLTATHVDTAIHSSRFRTPRATIVLAG
jgi:hypothetical protein